MSMYSLLSGGGILGAKTPAVNRLFTRFRVIGKGLGNRLLFNGLIVTFRTANLALHRPDKQGGVASNLCLRQILNLTRNNPNAE